MKVNGQYYHGVLLSEQMLPAIKHVACDTFLFQQDNAPSHRARTPLNCCCKKCRTSLVLSLATKQPRPESSDYNIWGVMHQRVYECRMNSVDELKQRLIEVWNSLQQNVDDAAINEWRKRLRACMRADGQHFEHLYIQLYSS